MADQTIDYAALAKQAGAVSSQPPPSGSVDYAALAKQAGAISSQPSKEVIDYNKPPETSPVQRFAENAWDEIEHGPANLAAVGNAMLRPVSTVQGMASQNQDLANRAEEAFKAGQYGEGIRHLTNYFMNVVPGVGSSSDVAGTQMEQGDIAGGLGRTAGVGANLAIGSKTPQIMEGAANLPETVRGVFRADPAIAMVRALRPTPSDSGFTDRLPDTLANIKSVAGKDITGVEDLIPATKAGIARHQQALEAWMTRARTMGAKAAGDPIADAAIQALPDTMMLENPQMAQGIAQQANAAYRGRQFTVDQLRTLLAEKNAELNSFYGRAEGQQAAKVTSGAPEAVVKAQRDAIAETLYRTLDPQGNGVGPRVIQRQTGDMIDILDAAQRRRNAIMAEKPVSTAEKIGRGATKYASLPVRLATGKPFGTAGLPFGATGEAEIAAGTSDPLIRKAFAAVGEPNAIPMPTAPWAPAGGAPRQLGSSTATPPPPDTSFVRGVPAQPPYRTRQLPAAAPGATPMSVQPSGPPGTAWRMPPAGSNAAFGTPPPLALPPPAINPNDLVVRLGPESGAPLPAENVKVIPRPPGMAKGGVVANKSGSVEDVVRGSANVPLSQEGGQEASNLGQLFAKKGFGKLRSDRIISGKLTRTQQTAQMIAQHAPSAKVLPPTAALDTWSTGFEGVPSEQADKKLEQYIRNPDSVPPKINKSMGAPPESFNTFKARYIGALQSAIADYLRHPNQRVIAVTHGRGIRLTRAWIKAGAKPDLSIDTEEMLRDDDKPAEVYRVALGYKGKLQIAPVDMGKPGDLKAGYFPVRHASTPWNHPDAAKALMGKSAGTEVDNSKVARITPLPPSSSPRPLQILS